MGIIELFVIAVGLAMDAFAVSVCKGLSLTKLKAKHVLSVGLYFGIFQALMPLIGYLGGKQFSHYIENIDHWIAFFLLAIIGVHMIKDALGEEASETDSSFETKIMLSLAIATSIDALAVGITFSFFEVNVLFASAIIGLVTFALSGAGICIGYLVKGKGMSRAGIFGGIILIGIGLKILLEHLGYLS